MHSCGFLHKESNYLTDIIHNSGQAVRINQVLVANSGRSSLITWRLEEVATYINVSNFGTIQAVMAKNYDSVCVDSVTDWAKNCPGDTRISSLHMAGDYWDEEQHQLLCAHLVHNRFRRSHICYLKICHFYHLDLIFYGFVQNLRISWMFFFPQKIMRPNLLEITIVGSSIL